MLPEKITLVDLDSPLVDYWNEAFKDVPQVSAEKGDYFDFPADAMVSPANSFGIMDGGIDLAIRRELGMHVEEEVQTQILERYHGELPIGAAVAVATKHAKWPWLIAAPTMRTPGNVRDTTNAYVAFRAVLLAIRQWNQSPVEFGPQKHAQEIKTLVCCGLATGCGKMTASRCAVQMKAAWDQVNGSPKFSGFAEIHAKERLLYTI